MLERVSDIGEFWGLIRRISELLNKEGIRSEQVTLESAMIRPLSSRAQDMNFWSRVIAWWKAVTICPERLAPWI